MKKTSGPKTVKSSLKEKAKKVKGSIQVSLRKTWFSDAMVELDKQDKEKQ